LHRLAIFDSVLSHPAAMELTNLDLNAGIVGSSVPHHFPGCVEVNEMRFVWSMLADFETAVGFNERLRQVSMDIGFTGDVS